MFSPMRVARTQMRLFRCTQPMTGIFENIGAACGTFVFAERNFFAAVFVVVVVGFVNVARCRHAIDSPPRLRLHFHRLRRRRRRHLLI